MDVIRVKSELDEVVLQRRTIVDTLQLLMDNVGTGKIRGLVCQLCSPRKAEYKNAVQAILEDVQYSIVCEDDATVKTCVKYLKDASDNKFPPLEFLSAHRLFDLTPSVRRPGRLPAIEALSLKNERDRPLFAALLKNVFIVDSCETCEDGMRLGVTRDGKYVRADGVMGVHDAYTSNVCQDAADEKIRKIDLHTARQQCDVWEQEREKLEWQRKSLEGRLDDLSRELSSLDDRDKDYKDHLESLQKARAIQVSASKNLFLEEISALDVCCTAELQAEAHKHFDMWLKEQEVLAFETFERSKPTTDMELLSRAVAKNEEAVEGVKEKQAELDEMEEEYKRCKRVVQEKEREVAEERRKKNDAQKKVVTNVQEKNRRQLERNELCRLWLQRLSQDATLHGVEDDFEAKIPCVYEKYRSFQLDYSSLPRVDEELDVSELASMESELGSSLAQKKEELLVRRQNRQNLNPGEIAAEIAKITTEIATKREALKEQCRRFDAAFVLRKEKLLDLVNFVKGRISSVYQKLHSADGPESFAELDFVDENDPFAKTDTGNSGLRFAVMPSGKRFQEVKQMSGGERTIAALALLFSIHQRKAPPFVLLDEVDAFLDAPRVVSLMRYIKDCPFQTIAISLKWCFFSTADALIGVWPKQGRSVFLLLDLKKCSAPVGDEDDGAAPLDNTQPRGG